MDTTPDLAGGATVAALATAHLIGVTGARPDDTTVRRLIESASAKTELVILAQDRDAEPTLTWRVQVAGATYYIRANGDDAGEVMAGTSTAQALTVTAADLSGDDRTINVEPAKWWFLFDSQALIDTTRNLTTYATGFNFFGLGTPWLPGNPSTRSLLFGWNRAGVSAHANMAAVYDYYLAVLGRDSIDGNGAPVVASVGYNPRADLWTLITGYANAFWDAEGQQFVFGDSGGFEGGLDIVAHEYTHGVISHVVGNGNSVLDYGESGALNEAYADILGTLIEDDLGSGRWLIGEDTSRPLRNLANPAAIGTGYRAHYDQRYIGPDDDGGEHWNSTIFSRAAYLMMTDSDAKAVSTDTWAKVFYNSLFRLSPGAKFVDGRAAILDTAAEYGFTDGQMQAVADAFDTVGIVGGSRSAGPEALTLIAL